MKEKRFLIIILTITLLTGCVSLNPSMDLIKYGRTDYFEQETIEGKYITNTMVIIPIGSKFSNEDDMALKVGKIKAPNNELSYFFSAEFHSTDWIFAEDINIKIDEKIYRLHDSSPNRQIISGTYIIEKLTFPISKEMMNAIFESNSFSAELYKRVVSLDSYQLEELKEFLK